MISREKQQNANETKKFNDARTIDLEIIKTLEKGYDSMVNHDVLNPHCEPMNKQLIMRVYGIMSRIFYALAARGLEPNLLDEAYNSTFSGLEYLGEHYL